MSVGLSKMPICKKLTVVPCRQPRGHMVAWARPLSPPRQCLRGAMRQRPAAVAPSRLEWRAHSIEGGVT